MFLSKLSLTTFRNYIVQEFSFSELTTVIIGSNAAGKTNILEAIYLLATGQSFRAEKIEEMVQWEAEVGHIQGSVSGTDGIPDRLAPHSRQAVDDDRLDLKSVSSLSTGGRDGVELQVTLTRGMVQGKRVNKRRLLVNGVPRRQKDFVGHIKAVVFLPEDLRLISGSPSRRRGFLDQVLIQVDPEYQRAIMAYEKALRQRNKLLDLIREHKAPRQALAFWDQSLVKNGEYLVDKRQAMAEAFNAMPAISKDWDLSLRIDYKPSTISPQRLEQYAQREVMVGHTLIGPHKDDFAITSTKHEAQSTKQITNHKFPMPQNEKDYGSLGEPFGRDLGIYGSRGEQRMGVLWLKLSQLAYLKQQTGEQPLLLLDDIFSELDAKHDAIVRSLLGQQQTIITTTDEGDVGGMRGVEVVRLGGN